MIGLQVLSRLDGPEVATVPGIVFWLLEGEGIHRHPATFQLSVIPAVDKHKCNHPHRQRERFHSTAISKNGLTPSSEPSGSTAAGTHQKIPQPAD